MLRSVFEGGRLKLELLWLLKGILEFELLFVWLRFQLENWCGPGRYVKILGPPQIHIGFTVGITNPPKWDPEP